MKSKNTIQKKQNIYQEFNEELEKLKKIQLLVVKQISDKIDEHKAGEVLKMINSHE